MKYLDDAGLGGSPTWQAGSTSPARISWPCCPTPEHPVDDVDYGAAPLTPVEPEEKARVEVALRGPLTTARLSALHAELTDKGRTLMETKNHDYTGGRHPLANFMAAERRGIDPALGLMLRVDDKLARVQTYIHRGELKVIGEGLEDAIVDVINYMVLLYAMLEERTKGSA